MLQVLAVFAAPEKTKPIWLENSAGQFWADPGCSE